MINIDLSEIFPFQLDEFQLKAIDSINRGQNILVTAPTGAGKTAIAEYAMYHARANDKKVFYTTPLKALSNQKYLDLSEQFGENNVGLLTGDTQINREAPIIVLTTEIFRNILYKSHQDTILDNMAYLILDECHYMKDTDRGTVWEECIIYAPPSSQIIALSATVGNPKQLASWIQSVHGEIQLITSDQRPVPLSHYFFGRRGLQPLMNQAKKINKNLIKEHFQARGQKIRDKKKYLPLLHQIVKALHDKDFLPAIYFVFSRKSCEASVQRLLEMDANFLSDIDRLAVQKELDKFVTVFPWFAEHQYFAALQRGIACHHAGMLPALKGLVERLFQQNLIKIVFATETLAAGINMPARTTVISQVSKRTDQGFRLLTSSEFLQMAGRAGRRGMDTIGYVVVIETPYEGILEVSDIVKSPPEDLHSAFMPSYTMILNLAERMSKEQAKVLVQKSFARFELLGEIKSIRHNLESASPKKKKKLVRTLDNLEQIPWNYFEDGIEVLIECGHITEGFGLAAKGKYAADLRVDNVVFLAEVLDKGVLEGLTAFELAGVVAGMTTYDLRWDNNMENSWAVSEQVYTSVMKIYEIVQQVSTIQAKHNVEFNVPFNPKLINIGFDWAVCSSWDEFTTKYRFSDEGDLVKILKQASDILKQISVYGGVDVAFAQKADEAYRYLYRSPIKDSVF